MGAALTLVAPALAQDVQTFEGQVVGAKGEPIGKIAIRSGKEATVVRITINAGGLTPGWHGVHFHQVGDCSDVGKFQLSKGHVNHDDDKHGLLNPDGPDDGDLPNIFANADGSVNAEVSTEEVRLDGKNALRDRDGSALVIHASEDDHTSQPIGNAGARVGCVVIK
ncbi:MAG: superoxide dismutase family protein [Pseudorhodoplanes sp.]|nr:superoxide dismutase family protein [Pseudorhodoplanes sp.]